MLHHLAAGDAVSLLIQRRTVNPDSAAAVYRGHQPSADAGFRGDAYRPAGSAETHAVCGIPIIIQATFVRWLFLYRIVEPNSGMIMITVVKL